MKSYALNKNAHGQTLMGEDEHFDGLKLILEMILNR